MMPRTLSENNLSDLAGNGMHLPCIAAWYLYVMSHVVRLEECKLVAEHVLATEVLSVGAVDSDLEDEVPIKGAEDSGEDAQENIYAEGAHDFDDRFADDLKVSVSKASDTELSE